MGVVRHNHHRLSTFTAFFTLLFFASASVVTLAQLGGGFQERDERESGSGSGVWDRIFTQKRLGPGSSPPTCRSKCGNCSPCQPVHVPIHPGFSMPLEYYPEAWRCKCGDKLFIP